MNWGDGSSDPLADIQRALGTGVSPYRPGSRGPFELECRSFDDSSEALFVIPLAALEAGRKPAIELALAMALDELLVEDGPLPWREGAERLVARAAQLSGLTLTVKIVDERQAPSAPR